MKEERIRKFSGEIIGIIETDDKGNKVARDFPSRLILGEYDAARDCTLDWPSRLVIGKGDSVVSLIYEKHPRS